MAERDNVGAALLLLFVDFYIGLTPILHYLRVDHRNLVRRFDENKKLLSLQKWEQYSFADTL